MTTRTAILCAAAALLCGLAPVAARADATVNRATASAAGPRLPHAPAPVVGLCNLNTADASQLALLPGIGPGKAQRIIAHRQKTPFKTVDEIVKVKGIGRKTFAKLRPHLSVSGPTTIARVKPATTTRQ